MPESLRSGHLSSASGCDIGEGVKAWHLGQFSDRSGYGELSAIVAALGMALDERLSRGRLRNVRVYTDADCTLQAITSSTDKVVGLIVDSADPLAIELVYDRAEVLSDLGVQVELHWVHAHNASHMNGLADQATRFAAACPPPGTPMQSGRTYELCPREDQPTRDGRNFKKTAALGWILRRP